MIWFGKCGWLGMEGTALQQGKRCMFLLDINCDKSMVSRLLLS